MPQAIDSLTIALNHQQAGRLADAEAIYRAVLAADPAQPNALYLYGVLTLAGQRWDEAAALLNQAVTARPDHAESALALANARHHLGDGAAAARLWQGILATHPDHRAAALNLTRHHRANGRLTEAITLARAALTHRPGDLSLWAELTDTLLQAGQNDAALTAASATLDIDPGHAGAWLARGTVLSRRRQFGAAGAALRHACGLDPLSARCALQLGNVLIDQDRLEEAQVQLERAVAFAPDLTEAHTSLGFLQATRGRCEAAVACHDQAIALRPYFAEAHSNRAAALLLSGDWERGWAAYEWRKHHAAYAQCFWRSTRPEWQGEALAGRTILVFCEQGFGDALMCARYVPLLTALGAAIVLVCAAPLMPLFSQLPGLTALVPRGKPLTGELVAAGSVVPDYDVWIDQLSLPLAFGTRTDSVPAPAGYLRADPALVATWRTRLPPGFKVGLVGRGHPDHGNDRRRSLPRGGWAPLLRLAGAGCQFVSLEPQPCGLAGVLDVSERLTDFGQTAAAIAAMDLIVSVDTAVAHLAGALGCPVWTLLAYAPDWRWLLGRADTPWYGSMRLFRQRRPAGWSGVVTQAATALTQSLARQPLSCVEYA